jgi:hypothetical protein
VASPFKQDYEPSGVIKNLQSDSQLLKKNSVPRNIQRIGKLKQQKNGENCIISFFIIYTLRPINIMRGWATLLAHISIKRILILKSRGRRNLRGLEIVGYY